MKKNGYAEVPSHICAMCGTSDSLVKEIRDIPFAYRNQTTVIHAVHGMFCTACGEGLDDPGNRAAGLLALRDIAQAYGGVQVNCLYTVG